MQRIGGCFRVAPHQALKRNIYRDLDLPRFVQCTRDLPCGWSINQVIRQGKLRSIKEVKNLAPQLESTSLFQFEVFEDGEVRIVKGGPAQCATASVSERRGIGGSGRWRRLPRSNGGKGEGRRVVPAVDILSGGGSATLRRASVVAAIEANGSVRIVIRIADSIGARTAGTGVGWIKRQIRREC